MSMEHWWNDIDRGRPKDLERNLCQLQVVDYRFKVLTTVNVKRVLCLLM
jgi:hypothetical protein